MSNPKVGDTVVTTDGWNRNYFSTGVIIDIDADDRIMVKWPSGLVSNSGSDLLIEPDGTDNWNFEHFESMEGIDFWPLLDLKSVDENVKTITKTYTVTVTYKIEEVK